MSGYFKFAIEKPESIVGKKSADFRPDIALTGAGIAKNQCKLIYDEAERSVTLTPNEEDPLNYSVKVNGKQVTEPVKLEHGDRILVGINFFYLFVDPKINNDADYEWEDANREANKEQMEKAAAAEREEAERKQKELQDKIDAERAAREKEIQEKESVLKAQEEAERARLAEMAEAMKQADMKEEEIKQRMAQQ